MSRYCKFFDRGYCFREEKCLFFHSQEICESLSREECGKILCIKRHPKMCRFNLHCDRRGVCTFRHINSGFMYVPGGGHKKDEQSDYMLLFKIFHRAQEEGRQGELTFFTKHGRSTVNMEIELTSSMDREDGVGENMYTNIFETSCTSCTEMSIEKRLHSNSQ